MIRSRFLISSYGRRTVHQCTSRSARCRPLVTIRDSRRYLEYVRSKIRIRPCSSSSTSNKKLPSATLTEHPIRPKAPTTIYTLETDESWSISKTKFMDDDGNVAASSKKKKTPHALFFENALTHFLPANYPASVAPGYDRFASLCFCASVAGSAGMVLSTQTLLLAVGIVGQNTQTASIMAGALNWVLKDGIGQLGGVWFASYMGRSGSSQFDANPKYWRMMAAICLDAATMLEIAAPLVPSGAVLALASVANVVKNIGFLTASASRAALHQSLALRGNLGDVTAKTGSQSMAASLVGTALGIGLSPVLGDVPHFMMGFLVLSFLHQGCNYLSLQAVPLSHFNRHRLHLVLQEAITADGENRNTNDNQQRRKVLSPAEVAAKETFLPFLKPEDSLDWLVLGSTIQDLGGPAAVQEATATAGADAATAAGYLLIQKDDSKLHLVFSRDAAASDLLEGVYHAYSVYHHSRVPNRQEFQSFQMQVEEQGWKLETELMRIEPPKAVRIDYSY